MMSTVQEIAFKFDYSTKSLTAFTEELSAENENIQEQLERRKKLITLCVTPFAVVVSALNSLKADNDDKAAQSMNAILRFEFIISLVVAEHILSSTVALTNYLQKPDIDLIEALTEAKIVIQRLSDESEQHIWQHNTKFSHQFLVSLDVNDTELTTRDPSDYWRVSLYFAFLDHLVDDITKRLISNEERFFSSYFIPTKLGNFTPEIADKIYNAYRSDLGDKTEFDDEVARWTAHWRIEDNRPDRLLGVLNVTHADLYPSVHRIIWILLTVPVSSATSQRSFSAMRRVKSYLRSTMGGEILFNL
ncbi:unnamed protein product [Mytilus coruscus]|uniref:HAT C-terminal dimerisation domain-containing protein n=1 Tax=Mytilus coruscus TaxID=42192 RepID=A0A6J8D210_MYTCO|nr:unnamed protein product [Mytilus coruscus]